MGISPYVKYTWNEQGYTFEPLKVIVERWDQYKLGNGPYVYNPREDKEFDTKEEAEEYMRTADSGFWNDTRHYYKIKGT